MVKAKHRDLVFPIMRHDFSGTDVCCAVAISHEIGDELAGEYTQQFLDRGYSPDEVYFYVTATAFHAR